VASKLSRTLALFAPLALTAGVIAGTLAGGPANAAAPVVASGTTSPTTCTVNAKLVPTCGLLWGAAAGGFTAVPRDTAEKTWEQASGRTAGVYHTYHRGDELIPTTAEIAMAHNQAQPRTLFLNWKVDYGTTFAAVARGAANARIDREAAYLKANFHDKFFITFHHEPENDVNAAKGSGMTAADFAAMFRHTVLRLRADGVTNMVTVVVYMSYEKWFNAPWWADLYPGNDVVDWIGLDAYLTAQPGGFHYGTFSDLMDRTTDPKKFPGFYQWTTRTHPDKPFMLAEWGVYENTADLTQKPKVFASVLPQLARYPALKGMLYFDSPKIQNGGDLRIDSSPAALAQFRKIATDPRFKVSRP
jgi:beta-mannanase